MAKLLIADLTEQQEFTGFFIVRGCNLRPLRDQSRSFLALRLADKSGEIDAKVWDGAEQWYEQLRIETVVKISARTQLFNGRLELNIGRLRVAREDEYSIEDFLPTSGRDRNAMLDELDAVIGSLANRHLVSLLNAIFGQAMRGEFAAAPGAKLVHHAYLGGLLEHTLEVVKLCNAAIEIHPHVDRDLLVAAALLHDIGKVREYVFRRSIDFLDEGRLIGHVALGEGLLVEHASRIASFPSDLLLHLRHMILSHHGQYEWQSPKRPKTIEACILHLADYFSSQMAIFDSVIKASAEGASWSDYNRFLGRAIFIREREVAATTLEDPLQGVRIYEDPYQGY